MRKATLVLATSVAFLLSVVPNSYAGTKKKVQLPTAQSVANGSGIPVKSGSSLSIPGALQGEFIPGDNPSRGTPIKVLPTFDYSIPRTITQVKGLLKSNAGSIVVGGVISGMIAGLDWVMSPDNTQIQFKENSPISYTPSGNQFYWRFLNHSTGNFPNPAAACATITIAPGDSMSMVREADHVYVCMSYERGPVGTAVRYGYGCPPDLTYNSSDGTCTITQYVPLNDAALSAVDPWVSSQSAEWLGRLLRESCNGSISPQRCFEDLKDNSSLSGPSTVPGPSAFTTSTGPNGTTTKETKTTFGITYGSDYFIYSPTTTTITVNPDGTTEVETEEETTEEEAQEEDIDTAIPDLYKPVIDKYDSISTDVEDAQGPGSGINWGPWYSFGGACTEIDAQLPYIGLWSTNYCPYIYDWVRPVLMFLFAVFTWHYCKEMFQEAIEKGRPV